MSKIAFAKAFYEQFYSFLKEMGEMYPEDTDFPTFETFLRMLQKTNPMKVLEIFHEQTQKFSEQINSKNEDFFLKYSYVEYGSNVTDVVGKLAGYFSAMTPDTKKCVWDYLYVLKELSHKAMVSSK